MTNTKTEKETVEPCECGHPDKTKCKYHIVGAVKEQPLDLEALLDEYVDCSTELWQECLTRFARETAEKRKKEIISLIRSRLK